MLKTRLFERYVDSGQMTAREVAARLGMTEAYISHIRNGNRPIAESFIARACMAFGRSRDELFYDDAAPVEARTAPTPGG